LAKLHSDAETPLCRRASDELKGRAALGRIKITSDHALLDRRMTQVISDYQRQNDFAGEVALVA